MEDMRDMRDILVGFLTTHLSDCTRVVSSLFIARRLKQYHPRPVDSRHMCSMGLYKRRQYPAATAPFNLFRSNSVISVILLPPKRNVVFLACSAWYGSPRERMFSPCLHAEH
jgi:hypothetical protein